MAEFKIFRYLKKWRFLIFLVVLLGSAAVYYYGSSRQHYTASAVLEYTSGSASLGQNPDGSMIDTSEIISASVITNVIDTLGLDTSVESVRSRFSITPIIPEEEEEKQETAIKNGEEYEYYPTKFLISFESAGKQDEDYVRDVLDALLSAYFVYYCENHVDDLALPNNASNVSVEHYDYIECVDMLYNNANTLVSYVQKKADSSYSFYSAATGYSFSDLVKSYEFVRDNGLTDLRSYILENRLTVSQELLLQKKENQKAQDEIAIENLGTHISEAKEIIEQFGNKTLEGQSSYIQGREDDEEDDSAIIMGDVENHYQTTEDGERIYHTETTYDQLINQYASLQESKIEYETDLGKCEEILEIYKKTNRVNEDSKSPEAVWARTQIEDIAGQFNDLYALLTRTLEEYNEQNGAQNLSMRSSIAVSESVNLKLYLLLAVVLFLVVGCMGAVVLGRIGDFVDYYVYVDHKTGLPNRQRCDIEIERYQGQVLKDDFSCIALKVALQFQDRPLTRKEGDEQLESFGQFLRILFKGEAFLGYNSGGVFLVFAENCTAERARSYLGSLNQMVDAHYRDKNVKVEYHAGYATTTTEDVYDIRGLMRAAFSNWKLELAGTAEEEEAAERG